jgi:hypothetical protein
MKSTHSQSAQPSIEPMPTSSSPMAMPTGASALQSASIRLRVTAARQGFLLVMIGNAPIFLPRSPKTEHPRASHTWCA